MLMEGSGSGSVLTNNLRIRIRIQEAKKHTDPENYFVMFSLVRQTTRRNDRNGKIFEPSLNGFIPVLTVVSRTFYTNPDPRIPKGEVQSDMTSPLADFFMILLCIGNY
jgi:hypothetical protein